MISPNPKPHDGWAKMGNTAAAIIVRQNGFIGTPNLFPVEHLLALPEPYRLSTFTRTGRVAPLMEKLTTLGPFYHYF